MADLPTNPWQLFELDRTTTSESEVKRAYAKLLKKHRPEHDPEGFQHVYAAYQAALAELRNGKPGETVGSALGLSAPEAGDVAENTATDASAAPTANYSPEFSVLQARLKRALAANAAQEINLCLEEFRTLMKGARSLWRPWGQILLEVFADAPDVLARHLPPPGVLRLVEVQQASLAQAIILAWHLSAEEEKLVKLARALITKPEVVADTEAAICVARLSSLLSFSQPAIGEELANVAFKYLPPVHRDHIMRQVESSLGLGRLFAGIPDENLRFWEARLTKDADLSSYDWTLPEAQSQLTFICQNVEGSWGGLPVLHQILPPAHWKRIEASLQEEQWSKASGPPQQRRRREVRYNGPAQRPLPWGLIIGAAIAIIRILAMIVEKR